MTKVLVLYFLSVLLFVLFVPFFFFQTLVRPLRMNRFSSLEKEGLMEKQCQIEPVLPQYFSQVGNNHRRKEQREYNRK